ncbi:RDD family protein [Neorhodopirellula pilleata]|uniref:RDD family protein n=1 Tax=Neorhodopirellula pilleata TaxID=2714738 RepID=UPI001E49DBCD|nr:RDD family protein [Neorhodopirellula pilleata]
MKIPDSAAGKVVKCPCGKQLRVPGGQPQGAGQRPTAAPATSAPRPAAASASGPASAGAGFGGFDAGMFDELTESDMRPVNVPRAANALAPQTSAATNPYASPASSGAGNTAAGGYSGKPNASQNQRLINFFLDNIMLQLGSVAMGVVVGLVWVVGSGEGEQQDLSQQMNFAMVTNAIGSVMFLLYYAGMEFIFGATPAKFLTGTRVVSNDGGKAGFGKILGRTFCRLIPFDAFSFCFGDTTTGWHDTLSGTRVVDINR